MRLLLAAAAFFTGAAAASACPDPSQYGSTHKLTGQDLYAEKTYRVKAGGDTSLGGCKSVSSAIDGGAGYVMGNPDFSFDLAGMDRYKLVLSVVSQCDSILLVNTGTGNWFYDDDDGGNLDARIELSRPANGWLDVWVGTHDGEYCDDMLGMETFDR